VDFTNILISIIGAGGITALITSWFNKQKTRAEVEQIVQNTYSRIISDLKAQIQNDKEFYSARILALEEDYQQLRHFLIQSEERNYRCLTVIEGFRSKNNNLSQENKRLLVENKDLNNKILKLDNRIKELLLTITNNQKKNEKNS